MEERGLGRLREAADRVMSLNLEGLDVEGLEQRLTLLERLRAQADPDIPRPCEDLKCGDFECGIY
jgi:hypothetical protein